MRNARSNAARRAASLLRIALPLVATLTARAAMAEPQATAALTLGAAGAGKEGRFWDDTLFHLGLRGDVLFGRSQSSDFGFGPYLEVATYAFHEVQFGGGGSVLFPVSEYVPLVLSVGAYGRKGDDAFGVEPGLAAELFWGSRSYNFHANYVMSAGLIAQMRYGLGDSRETSIVIGAQLDLVAMSLPVVFLVNAIKGGSHDTDPVEPE